jgi:hypothetical protein
MVTMEDVRESALRFPGVEELPHHGSVAFKVDGKIFAGPEHAAGTVDIAIDLATAVGLIAQEPDVFGEVWRPGAQPTFAGVRVAIRSVGRPRLDDLVETAWRHQALDETVAAYDASR